MPSYDGVMAPSYHRLGEVPAKRHVAFRAPDGRLYEEEVVGTEGFAGRYSILYHRHVPSTREQGGRGRPDPDAADALG